MKGKKFERKRKKTKLKKFLNLIRNFYKEWKKYKNVELPKII